MKTSYSKVIMTSVLASAFLMVSCQKRGIKGAEKVATPPSATQTEQMKPEAGPTPDISQTTPGQTETRTGDRTIPQPTTPTVAPTPEEKTSDKKEETQAETEETKVDAKVETKEPTVVVPQDDKATEETKTQDAKPETKSQAKVEDKNCSSDLITLGASMSNKYKDTTDLNRTDTSKDAENAKAYLAMCDQFIGLLEKLPNQSCDFADKNGNKILITTQTFDKSCAYVGKKSELLGNPNKYAKKYDEKIKQDLALVKKSSLTVTEEAKALFNKENLNWKMFITEGKTLSDSRLLIDSEKARKISCSIVGQGFDLINGNLLTMRITSVTDLTKATEYIKTGVVLKIKAKSQDKENAAKADAAVEKDLQMVCSQLNKNTANITNLKKAFGKLITIK